jgi:hypothetical protein
MLSDLAALTPPAVVCVAFLIGVGIFLRHQLGPKHESAEDEYQGDISGDSGIPHTVSSESATRADRGEGVADAREPGSRPPGESR